VSPSGNGIFEVGGVDPTGGLLVQFALLVALVEVGRRAVGVRILVEGVALDGAAVKEPGVPTSGGHGLRKPGTGASEETGGVGEPAQSEGGTWSTAHIRMAEAVPSMVGSLLA
jgi:hypothetical protein